MEPNMQVYKDQQIVELVYRRLNRECSVVDVDDTISYLDSCSDAKRVEECKIIVEVDYTGSMRLRSIMCSVCYKLFNYPEKKMLKHNDLYYCISCTRDGLGRKDTIRNFMLEKKY